MTNLLTLLVAVLVFGLLVLVHELGHFLAARRCGIRVEEFSIGFGPALLSREKNGTRFTLRLVPLGGYNLLTAPPQEEGEEARPAPPRSRAYARRGRGGGAAPAGERG